MDFMNTTNPFFSSEYTLLRGITSFLPFMQENKDGTARNGCGNSSFEVFGFLAFGLYLLNLAMNMKKRRKRSTDVCSDQFQSINEPDHIEGMLAFSSMFQGFLTAIYDGEGVEKNIF